MVYTKRNTTATHANGTDIPNTQTDDDLRHPNSTKKLPSELHQGATYADSTDFTVKPNHGQTTASLPTIPETTTDYRDEDMP